MKIREITESIEKQNLSKYAALSVNTEDGRLMKKNATLELITRGTGTEYCIRKHSEDLT